MSQAAISSAPPAPAAGPVRVMVVDDSAVARGLLSRWLGEVPELEVVASMRTGLQAVNGALAAAPDVIVLDIEMPEMDGITALPLLRAKLPGAAIIMASNLTRRNAKISLKALSLGARDCIAKPEGNHGITTSLEFRRELVAKVLALGGVARRRAAPIRPSREAPLLRRFSRLRPGVVVAIGSSTGGPQALQALFAATGDALGDVPVLVTQHMPATFTAILAEHIARVSGRPCREGADDEPLMPGHIYVAPGGRHMSLKARDGGNAIRLHDDPPINFCKPAVDPLFDSVAELFGAAALAVVLTGMGSDGARGALRIADAGGSVIAQDEATSVVWGMPGAAAAMGACAAVLPLVEIGAKMNTLLTGRLA